MNERVVVNLDRMLEAATNAIAMTDETTLAEFVSDEKTKLAVMMCFVIIGEAAGKIASKIPEFVDEHPDWAWSQMRGMRNVAAHAYFDLDFEDVWNTVRDFLPALVAQIEAMGPLDPRERQT